MGPAKDKHGVRESFAKVKFLFAKNGRSGTKEFYICIVLWDVAVYLWLRNTRQCLFILVQYNMQRALVQSFCSIYGHLNEHWMRGLGALVLPPSLISTISRSLHNPWLLPLVGLHQHRMCRSCQIVQAEKESLFPKRRAPVCNSSVRFRPSYQAVVSSQRVQM